MIGDTASINLLTGLPGSGKSLRMVQAIATLVEKGEHVFTCNLNGIRVPGVTKWEDPTAWRDLPAGSVLFVDEAQQFFRARRGGDPPEFISAMETIRHHGVRLVLATQQPNYLDTHLRGLVGFHEHLLRMHGKDKTFIFRHQTVMDSIREPFAKIKRLYDYESWKLPAEFFKFYDSAELHTMKYSMPALMKKALIAGPVAIAVIVGVWLMVFSDGYSKAYGEAGAEDKTAQLAAPTPSAPASTSAAATVRKSSIATAGDYAVALTPLIEGYAFSAPAFVDRPIVAEPEAFCALSGSGDDAQGEHRPSSCTCLTEQGTRFQVPRDVCETFAKSGQPYNPFKAPVRAELQGPAGGGGGEPPPAMDAKASAPSPGAVLTAPQVSGYGSLGIGEQGQTAP